MVPEGRYAKVVWNSGVNEQMHRRWVQEHYDTREEMMKLWTHGMQYTVGNRMPYIIEGPSSLNRLYLGQIIAMICPIIRSAEQRMIETTMMFLQPGQAIRWGIKTPYFLQAPQEFSNIRHTGKKPGTKLTLYHGTNPYNAVCIGFSSSFGTSYNSEYMTGQATYVKTIGTETPILWTSSSYACARGYAYGSLSEPLYNGMRNSYTGCNGPQIGIVYEMTIDHTEILWKVDRKKTGYHQLTIRPNRAEVTAIYFVCLALTEKSKNNRDEITASISKSTKIRRLLRHAKQFLVVPSNHDINLAKQDVQLPFVPKVRVKDVVLPMSKVLKPGRVDVKQTHAQGKNQSSSSSSTDQAIPPLQDQAINPEAEDEITEEDKKEIDEMIQHVSIVCTSTDKKFGPRWADLVDEDDDDDDETKTDSPYERFIEV